MKQTVKEKIENLKKYINERDIDNAKKEELTYIETQFKGIYEDLVMFLISKKDRYYGYIIMNMQLEVDFYADTIAGVSCISRNPMTLLINPFLFLEFSLKEMLFILCHEIEHLVLNHPSETLRINPSLEANKTRLLNYAMDCSINERLNYEIAQGNDNFLSMPKGSVTKKTIEELANKANLADLESYLYYYEYIKDLKQVEPISMGLGDTEQSNGKGNGEGKQIITPKNSQKGGEFAFEMNEDSEYISEATKEFVKMAVEAITEENRGLLPAYQQEALERLLGKPKINWKQVLKQYIGNIPIPFKKTKTRLNRRQPTRFDLSGKLSDRTVKLVVAIDTSGSMSDECIKNVMIEIFEIVKNRKHEITIIECDAEINKVYKVKTIKDIDNKVSGRGGTSFVPVIEYINKNSYFRDSVLIYFTDGFGDCQIPRPKTYRNLWVVIGNEENLSLEEPYGKVMKLDVDENYYDDIPF